MHVWLMSIVFCSNDLFGFIIVPNLEAFVTAVGYAVM